jgi:glucose-1-phosphate cytidylyltransferase
MKVIILAGGFGTRLSEYTETIPKPMVKIGGKPILWHIMNRYAYYGHNDFYIALGYKADAIKEYFLTYKSINSDFKVDLSTGDIETYNSKKINWKVTMIDTGNNSMTGGRVKRIQSYIGNEPFMLTYGDGIADVDIDKQLKFHKDHGKMVTVTAVHPVARFGELELNQNKVISFKEKPQVNKGWINGGFFICQPEFFKHIKDDNTILEKEPLEKTAQLNQLMAYKHDSFWQCMDTKRDKDLLEELWNSDSCPWKI